MEILEQLQDKYTKSQQKRITFRKLYQNRSLTYSQVDRLKTAEALFECIPITFYMPFSLLFMRQVANANTGPKIFRFVGTLTLSLPLIEFGTQSVKDKYYWPIVRKTYLDLKESENKRKQQVENVFLNISKPVENKQIQEKQKESEDDKAEKEEVRSIEEIDQLRNYSESILVKYKRCYQFFKE